MGGYGNHGGWGGQGLLKSLSPTCEPGPDFEACQRDLNIGTAWAALGVVAFICLAGGICWLVLSGKWSLMLIELEQKIRSLHR